MVANNNFAGPACIKSRMCKYPDPLEPGRVAGRGVLLEGNDSKGVGSASSTSVTFMLDNYSESAVDCSLLLQVLQLYGF